MKGEVALVTRNIKIIGASYDQIEEEMFGGRILISKAKMNNKNLFGSARLSNVEIKRGGQYGWSSNYDPRFAITFLGVNGTLIGSDKVSFVKRCSFDWNYNSAVGFFGANEIIFEGNSITRYINDGVQDEGSSNILKHNLVTFGQAIARIRNLRNLNFYGGFNLVKSSGSILENNVVSGSSQAGFKLPGIPCDEVNTWIGNEAHSSQHGLHVTNKRWYSWQCVKVSEFLSWKNWDYGIYAIHTDSLKIENCILVDNGAGFVSQTIGPNAATHRYEDKFIEINDTVIVGSSSSFDCSEEEIEPDYTRAPVEKQRRGQIRLADLRNRFAENMLGHRINRIALSWPMFMSSWPPEWQAWDKPIVDAGGSYPSLRGIMLLNRITFANFNKNCEDKMGKVLRPPTNDDFNFPIKASEVSFVNVANMDKVFIDRPFSPVHPKDCVDFDCDGFKKLLLIDLDGSFNGNGKPSTIIPDSAYEWDGNPKRGLGYYRVPEQMILGDNGVRINYEDKMPNTGIIRNSNCTWIPEWVAYQCHSINHKVMIMESLDRDSQFRRLSPIALLSNPGSDGYIDLINGPQDHTCCSGYTCSFRLSTFYTIVGMDNDYEIVLSSTPPQNLRFHILDNQEQKPVRLKIWFPKQQRFDVYNDDKFVFPNNYDFSSGKYSLKPGDSSYVPTFDQINGANYFDPNTGNLHILLRGPGVVNIKTQPVVILKLGMTVPIENFFEENVIANIAGLLGIDPKNIRITEIVREGSTGKKKRSTDIIKEIKFEIAPEPSSTFDENEIASVTIPPSNVQTTTTQDPLNTFTVTTASTSSTTSMPSNDTLSYENLNSLQAIIANEFQIGNIGTVLGLNITKLSMEEPLPPPTEPNLSTDTFDRQFVDENALPYAIQSQINDSLVLANLKEEVDFKIPTMIRLLRGPTNVKEMLRMETYPIVEFLDAEGYPITAVGDDSEPWLVSATLVGGSGGVLLGKTDVEVLEGQASFKDLHINKTGINYKLMFNVTKPEKTTIAGIMSDRFLVSERPLGLKMINETSMIPANSTFSAEFTIWDVAVNAPAARSILEGKTWECEISTNPATEFLEGEPVLQVSAGKQMFLIFIIFE